VRRSTRSPSLDDSALGGSARPTPYRPPEVVFADRNHAVVALVFDRPYEPFSVGIRVGCLTRRLHHADPHLAQPRANRRAPLAIAVADQHAMADEDPLIRHARSRPPS